MLPLESYESFTRHLEDREYFGQKLGLERIQHLLDRLGNPEKKFQSIHIAGTNGKGSTAAMIASILTESGYRTGLFTSPHLNDFCERVRIGSEEISRDEVLHWARRIREVEVEELSFFEMATAIGFLHFSSKGCPVAVIETGLGGRLDATNVLDPILSVITTVGRDHMQFLGETIEEIAYEKAGIIKPGVPIVTGPLVPEAMEVIREAAGVKGSRFIPLYTPLIPPNIRLRLEGNHQRSNAALALATIDMLRTLHQFSIDQDAVWRGLENVSWPGRLETVFEEPWVLLDGAHNPEAMGAVRDFMEENLKGRRMKVVFGAMADKEISKILEEIASLTDEFIFTAPRLKRAATPRALLEAASRFGKKNCVVEEVDQAVESTLNRMTAEDVLLITGSLFVVGEARKWLENRS